MQWQVLCAEVPKRVDALAMAGGEQVWVTELLWVPLVVGDKDKAVRGTWVLKTSTYPCIL